MHFRTGRERTLKHRKSKPGALFHPNGWPSSKNGGLADSAGEPRDGTSLLHGWGRGLRGNPAHRRQLAESYPDHKRTLHCWEFTLCACPLVERWCSTGGEHEKQPRWETGKRTTNVHTMEHRLTAERERLGGDRRHTPAPHVMRSPLGRSSSRRRSLAPAPPRTPFGQPTSETLPGAERD